MLNTRKAQFSLEYAVLIVCLVLGVVAMRDYLTRSIEGKYRKTADSIGEQYAPGKTTSDIIDTSASDITTTVVTTESQGTTLSTTQAWDTGDPNTGEQIPEVNARIGTETIRP